MHIACYIADLTSFMLSGHYVSRLEKILYSIGERLFSTSSGG